MRNLLSKRNRDRRDFLKSFCTEKCSAGKGGNVCRCNGYHFAGKRSQDPYFDEDQSRAMVDLNDNNDDMDKDFANDFFDDNQHILRGAEASEKLPREEADLLLEIKTLIPQILEDDSLARSIDDDRTAMQEYLRSRGV
ncbi:hypothetical protein DPMN_075020 [Dreissena polymorpha]|uniref:Uncharacterized protein n=1 Tax=Dreissena polymorpha TaxID=45954 RepID=A0A9D4BL66_DREPO|nr:hypothetical protein DPMN_075020 [Dreissena polymorpha]